MATLVMATRFGVRLSYLPGCGGGVGVSKWLKSAELTAAREGPGRDRTGATERRPVEGGTGAACARAAKDAVLVSADATM